MAFPISVGARSVAAIAQLPRHPGTEREHPPDAPRDTPAGTRWPAYAFAVIAVIAVLTMVVLHLTGVMGPAAHQP